MFAASTQKRHWIFTPQAIEERRRQTIENFRLKYEILFEPGEQEMLFNPADELLMQRIVEHSAIKFADSFHPRMFASVKWTAYSYFKRLFLDWSAMDFSPKIVMMACFYVAMKTDEFFITIDQFVENLRTGTYEGNIQRILGLEPEILKALKYHLTVHAPYRPFEGHMMDIKRHIPHLSFDVESIRPDAYRFFDECLLSDAILLYAPAHIALAAVLYGLTQQNRAVDTLSETLTKVLGVQEDPWNGKNKEEMSNVDRLMDKLFEIVNHVTRSKEKFEQDRKLHSEALMQKADQFAALNKELDERKAKHPAFFRRRDQPIDSDED